MAERNARRTEITRDFDSMDRAFYWVECWDLTADEPELERMAFRTLKDAREFAESWQNHGETGQISGVDIG
jgi:hypothetical protein